MHILLKLKTVFRIHPIKSSTLPTTSEEGLRGYPTIFTDRLTLKLNYPNTESVQLDLYDSHGYLVKNIYQGSIGVQTLDLSTHELTNQMYFIRMILDSEEVMVIKVIKNQ